MTAQRPNELPPEVRRRAPGAGRFRDVAVTAAALPSVVLSSVALASPASATPGQQAPTTQAPSSHAPAVHAATSQAAAARVAGPAGGRLHAPTIVPAAMVAAQVPAPRVAVPRANPKQYTVVAGDTISAIAQRHGLSTDAVLQLNRMNARTVIFPGQKITVSGGTAPAPAAPAPVAPAPGKGTYTVKSGDTLGAIALRHGVSLQSILSANGLTQSAIIHPGQKIVLAGNQTAQPPAPRPAPPAPAPAAGAYTVKGGDTLGAIAARNGVGLTSLLTANGLSMTSVIHPGRRLVIPGRTAPAPAPAPTGSVPTTFLGYTYPDRVVADANANKALLNSMPAPSQAEMKQIVADTARSMGVDPALALAFAFQESSFNQRAVSPANAIGAMQVIPSSGAWASELVGRKLNLLDPRDNATAGVAIIRSLIRTSPSLDIAIASYYQGQYSVKTHGMYSDTKQYVASIKAHQKTFR